MAQKLMYARSEHEEYFLTHRCLSLNSKAVRVHINRFSQVKKKQNGTEAYGSPRQRGDHFCNTQHSDATCVIPIISQLILTIATSSASPELKVTFFWVADHVLRVCRPLRITPLLVLLAVFLQPAQSDSVASWNSKLKRFGERPTK